ncbi:MAG: histidine kinase [Oscillospiraceae bacterium]|nr:histidine kinase [Oscillospiraceae bacterium]
MDRRKTAWPYIKGYKFNSLLLKNFAYVFILVTLPLLVVLSLNFKNFSEVVDKRVMDTNEELLQKNAVVTDNAMDGLLDMLNVMTQLNQVRDVVQMETIDADYYDAVTKAVIPVESHTTSNNLIKASYIYSDINEMLISDNVAMPVDRVLNRGKWYDIHKNDPMYYPYILVNDINSVFVCQPIWSAKGKCAGLFVLDVDLQRLHSVLGNQKNNHEGLFFIVDANGQTIYCNEESYADWDLGKKNEYQKDIAGVQAGTTKIIADHGNRIVSIMESTHKSWRYAFVTQKPDYEEEAGVVQNFLISSVSIGVVTSLIVAYLITMLTYRPIRKIMNVINNPKLHWNEKEATKQSNELLYITSNIMADMQKDEEVSEETSQELEERIRALRQAQFRALQFQIDPHFLYNTLETIKWSAVEEMGLGNKVSKMLTKVARLYRFGLENDDVIITLKEELDFLKLYIEILQIRFGDSIKFHWQIDESLYDSTIIKMCLQPIVENAIQHGLRPKNYLGNITISATCEDECLHICVENDGQVMSQEEMDKLNNKLKTGAGFEESKVGLRNVNERIKLIYGGKYGVSVCHGQGSEDLPEEANVRVVLTFPCRNIN